MSTNHQYICNASVEKISVIVTAMTDDEKLFLYETIEAVLADSMIGQVILCIDPKNDWLDETIGDFMKDDRIEMLRLSLIPIGGVRNRALEKVKYPWVAYCDGDDVWCKNKTAIQLSFAEKHGADLIGAGHFITNEKGFIRAYGLSLYIPMVSCWLVKTEVMKRYPFIEGQYTGSDGEWWIHTADNIKKVKCPEALIRYRVRASSVSVESPSKKRKHLLVDLAEIFLVGNVIYVISYFLWIATRQQPYRWMTKWSRKNSSIKKSVMGSIYYQESGKL